MMHSEIFIGDVNSPLFYFTNAEIVSSSGDYTVDLVANELSIDRFTPIIQYKFYAQMALQPTDYDALQTTDGFILCGFYNANPAETPYGTECWHYVNGALSRKLYVDYVRRVARDQWEINAISIIGILDVQPHRGGVYTGKTFAEVLTEFFGGTVGPSANGLTPITGGLADCIVENAVATTTVHGLLPYSESKRDNLHQLIFAYCVNMTMDANGDILFSYLKENENSPLIPRDRIYIGGDVAYEQPVTDVELTEYTYVFDETAEREDVYDNTSAPHIEGEALVTFDPPINPDTIEVSEAEMTVRDANETSAYVTGNGIISAIPYQVQSRIISRRNDITPVRKTVSVSNVTLINPLNSSNVMDRLYDFYTQRRVVKSTIVLEDEKPGALYEFYNPYDELNKGFIQRMRWNTTSLTRADCEIITDYTPPGIMMNMQNVILLTGSGVWTVPSAIRERDNPFIRATIIQGGTGGHGGYSGEDSERRPDSPGAGGAGGEGGEGGKVLTVDIDVTNIEVINYYCGDGGEGGEGGEAGSEGGETTFGDYSSAAGAHVPGGIMNIIDGKFYARSGSAGYAGAAGGEGATSSGSTPTEAELAAYGANGKSLTVKDKTWAGGKGGRTTNASAGGYFGWAFGGGGGGAAHGAKGGNGTAGHVEWQAVIGGFGGSGATATTPGDDAQSIGCGGNGGHGGGGGGAPGNSGFSGGTASVGYVGEGGNGSKGGKGAPGGILIYY